MSQNGSGLPSYDREGHEAREPAFNAPWPALLLTVGLIALYAWQARFPDQQAVFFRYGLIPIADGEGGRFGVFGEGRGARLLTSLFVHGNWAHVLLNAVGALAFGAGAARLFGTRPAGSLAFFVLFLVCGALGAAGFAALNAGSPLVLIGASGGVSGLMGAASRAIDRRYGLAPFTSPTVLGMAAGWIVVNLLVAVLGFAPGAGTTPVAWEAHLAGYAVGLVLVGPIVRLLGRDRAGPFDSRA